MGFDFNAILSLLPSLWGFSFSLGHEIFFFFFFFGGMQHSLVDGCSAASFNFGVLAGEDVCTSFYSTISIA